MKSRAFLIMALLLVASMVLTTFKIKGLHGIEEWSWWAVTAPLWGYPALLFSLFAIYFILALVLKMFGKEVRDVRK